MRTGYAVVLRIVLLRDPNIVNKDTIFKFSIWSRVVIQIVLPVAVLATGHIMG